MSRCRYEDLIDGYLLNKLDAEEAERFEEHIFNCSQCFARLKEREAIIKTIKAYGPALIENLEGEQSRLARWTDDLWLAVANRQWLFAPALATLLIVVLLIFSPFSKEQPPSFVLNGESVIRGQGIDLISPIIDITQPPHFFEWKKQGDNLVYRISIYDRNNHLLWTSTTQETYITLPEEIRQQMKLGEKYSWQVKAFGPRGTLLAVSSRVQFIIKNNN